MVASVKSSTAWKRWNPNVKLLPGDDYIAPVRSTSELFYGVVVCFVGLREM